MEFIVQGFTIVIAIGALLAAGSIVGFTIKNGISPMPSSSEASKLVAKMLKKHIQQPQSIIVEAGSGWGTLLYRLGRTHPEHEWIGLENSYVPYWTSVMIKQIFTLTNVSIKRLDMYRYSFEQANAVVCYLYPGAMIKLKKQFEEQLQPDAHIVSICFAIPGWQPIQVLQCKDMYRTKIYVYKKT